ncbi:MAG: SDR family NAD(P)-dependent oxidoreductase [bacterium]|nr:SDR family NAD(P)-dependent oxidoreductase [bacterium]
MTESADRAIAIVGVSAILPDAPDVASFWSNIKAGRYSIGEVPPERWDPALYYDADPSVPGKTYSQIGGFVREWEWEPMKWKLPIPPKVADAMDDAQKWAVACARAVLADYGYPERPLDKKRTAVIVGTAMAGDLHYWTSLPIFFPEYARALGEAPSFAELQEDVREAITAQLHDRMVERFPEVSEDSMPGELANCIAGRIANLFDLHGPNFICDAACASALAAIDAAHEGLVTGEYDTALVGGVDRNMGPAPFVKFCKIGALSATGTRPYAAGADGFVMGEGAAFFLLKRLPDAEAAGDSIYAVLRGVGGASDGRGKGITAPNPVGQRLALERAWADAGLSPATAGMVEGHGTSTRVGDVVEVETMQAVFSGPDLAPRSIALGSVKSNIGHLKGAAGAAGLLKAVLALHEKVLPPSLNFDKPNPNLDFDKGPLYVNTELKPWDTPPDGVRRAGVSAFGFGGTNFHAVLEEHVPGLLESRRGAGEQARGAGTAGTTTVELRAPLRGAVVLGASDEAGLLARLDTLRQEADAGRTPPLQAPVEADLRADHRLAIAYADAGELAAKATRARKALEAEPDARAPMLRALRAQGVFLGHGEPGRVAFLYTGQGSQYVNMLSDLRASESVVRRTFAEADRVLTPLLDGTPLSQILFVEPGDEAATKAAEQQLRQTEITQPAVLTVDAALTRLLAEYGLTPDLVMGHSLGEYGALVAAGALPFEDALEAVSARGREMADLTIDDNGLMAAVFAPLEEIEAVVAETDGNVVVANLNSTSQAVIGGATAAVERAVAALQAAGHQVVGLPVSHAFHTSIVAPVSVPLRRTLERLRLASPTLPLIGNVDGKPYPMGPDVVPEMIDRLASQVASPVQFVKGLETLYEMGARVFVEVGPKKALHGFAEDVLAARDDVVTLFTNHPKVGDVASFDQALCGLWAAGLGLGRDAVASRPAASSAASAAMSASMAPIASSTPPVVAPVGEARYAELGKLFSEFLERGSRILHSDDGPRSTAPPVVSGAGLGLPGRENVFDDGNVQHILDGEQEIDLIPTRFRHAMLDKNITRLVKSEGEPHFEAIGSSSEVIKLAARAGHHDLAEEFGVPRERTLALDVTTKLAMGAGLEAMRDAGLPLVMRYRTTTKGTKLPDRWMLPEDLRDETGVIFASAFPGYDSFADELNRYHADHARTQREELLRELLGRAREEGSASQVLATEIERRLHELAEEQAEEAYEFDRRFLFRVLPMAHAQFAEYVGARGPNTHVNSACASTTQAFALAEDWIAAGRCRRVVVIGADDVTTDQLLEWVGSGFLATGAAATDDVVEEAALPFDRRRHGMILGMGAVGIVIEAPACLQERGLRPICDVLSTVTANSAFHGTRLDVQHIAGVMERLVAQAEHRAGLDRRAIARELLFVSHETYTPARGGSASAEVEALRHVFGDAAAEIVVANTKGLTGHPMGVGIEDVVAVKALETGTVPPVPNYREPDPDLGPLHLSRGGSYPVRYALRLGAGFGSQISMSLLRWAPTPDGSRPCADELGYETRLEDASAYRNWLARVTGHDEAEAERVGRTLRVRDVGAPTGFVSAAPAAVAIAPAPETSRVAEPASSAPTTTAEGEEAAILERVLAIVAKATGYPTDMLDPDLDLEADLGIDTVKQAETFAAIREGWDIPRDENLKLRDYPTIAHAVQFVVERMPESARGDAPPAGSPPASASTASAEGEEAAILERVLAIVAKATGYPTDMLDPDLDLEADLGIDTVKQAETFAAIREGWDIPRDENLKLRDYPTIAHAVQFVLDRKAGDAGAPAKSSPDASEAKASKDPGAPTRATAAASDALRPPRGVDEAGMAQLRRVPVIALRPELERCKETGIALTAGDRVALLADAGGVGEALASRLTERKVEVIGLDAQADGAALVRKLAKLRAKGPIAGLYWLPALDPAGDPDEIGLAEWRASLDARVKRLVGVARELYDDLGETGRFLVAATRMGGRHGLGGEPLPAPEGGAVAGFVKAFGRERPAALSKVVDFAGNAGPEEVAEALLAETLRDPGTVEVGIAAGVRAGVALDERPSEDGGGLALDSKSVFWVTGAAGSIVSAIVADLAAGVGGGVFHLLDLAPAPDLEDPDVLRFGTDRDGLRREIMERMRAKGGRVTPVQVERELSRIERVHAAAVAVQAVRTAGGEAHWHTLDLTDGEAVAKLGEELLSGGGSVDVLIHAAGLERSRALPDKTDDEFDLVFDVKCDGWFNLIRALRGTQVRATVAFSSISGRFGNAGQTDYSAANDLLCKFASHISAVRPGTRALAIDWTAWSGIGMASRGSIPEVMARAGIDMLSPEAGIPIVRQELLGSSRCGEVLIAGALGVMEAERDPTGGLSVEKERSLGALGLQITGLAGGGIVRAEALLQPDDQPFLDHHRIEGTPVLPGVMGLEAFAELASAIAPDRHVVVAFEDVSFLAPFKFYRDEPRKILLEARMAPAKEGDGWIAHCRMLGERMLPGRDEPQVTVHFRASVRLAAEPPTEESVAVPKGEPRVGVDTIYQLYFHGPAYRVLAGAFGDGERVVGCMAQELPAHHHPEDSPLASRPLLLELCFQAAGLGEMAGTGRMALPSAIARVELPHDPPSPGEELRAVVEEGGKDAFVVDANGRVRLRMRGYATTALPGELPDALRDPLRSGLKEQG